MANEEGTLQDKLYRFLMMYRKTPNSATGLSPAEMMFKRLYRTRIDLVKRVPEIRMKNDNDDKIVKKEFKRGDRVQIRMYDNNKWKLGTITERKGKLHYEVEVEGKLHERHTDQIKKTSCSGDVPYVYLPRPSSPTTETTPIQPDVETAAPINPEGVHDAQKVPSPSKRQSIVSDSITLPVPTDIQPESQTLEKPSEATLHETVEIPTEPVLRRSSRNRKAPTRLNL
ncbi:uncharacterized protein LOC133523868 [Cydia pomonella]|uniref:uncharacterized protein LOC133523868 n=1 Tax=Cydia pomonella TaxID=82600 RepID=UPI002ADD5D5A|nr:uncharacterized protein LOC133523868 [Cydia pomonella]